MSEFRDRFQHYLDALSPAIGRHSRRQQHFRNYCSALTLPIERKSIEPIAATVDPDHVQASHQSLHNFVTSAAWSDRAVLDFTTATVLEALGDEEEVFWLVDDTGIPKKGRHSVGVSHQYCGQLGKQANCQVAVSLSLSTASASIPTDYRLYLPKSWVEDPERCRDAGVPEAAIRFRTKPEIAIEQITAALERGIAPGVVCADAGYGHDGSFREALTTLGLEYLLGIQSTTRVVRTGQSLDSALSVDELARSLDRRAFRHVTWREGTSTPLHSWFARVRVQVVSGDGKRRRRGVEQWLLIEWEPGLAEPSSFALSTLPASSPLTRLVEVAGQRWRIERDYQILKQEVGLNHFEGRSWRGFHHHASLCIATYAFLVLERLRHPGREKNRHRPEEPALPEGYIPRGSPAHAETR